MKSSDCCALVMLIVACSLFLSISATTGRYGNRPNHYKCARVEPTYCNRTNWGVDARIDVQRNDALARETVESMNFVDSFCEDRAKNYYCAVYFPLCHSDNPAQPVCIDVCEEFIDDCTFNSRYSCNNAVGSPCTGITVYAHERGAAGTLTVQKSVLIAVTLLFVLVQLL